MNATFITNEYAMFKTCSSIMSTSQHVKFTGQNKNNYNTDGVFSDIYSGRPK